MHQEGVSRGILALLCKQGLLKEEELFAMLDTDDTSHLSSSGAPSGWAGDGGGPTVAGVGKGLAGDGSGGQQGADAGAGMAVGADVFRI
jgi:hypothetical protein